MWLRAWLYRLVFVIAREVWLYLSPPDLDRAGAESAGRVEVMSSSQSV